MNNKKFWFIDVPSWSIILMPILLVSGPLLSDFALSLVSILFLINSYKNNLKKYYNNIYFKLFLVFCIVLIISSLQSNNILLSLKNSFFYFRFGIFSLCFWYLLDKNSRLLKYLFYSVIICFLALIVDGYIQYLLGENLLGTKLYNKYRVSSFFGDELILGSYLARFFPILFGLFVFFDEMKKKFPDLEMIFCSGETRVDRAIQCLRSGASDYVTKPIDKANLRFIVDRTLEKSFLRQKVETMTPMIHPHPVEFIGESPSMKKIVEKLSTSEEGSEDFLSALTAIYDSFEGEHELKAYTLATVKPEEAWTETEELYHASVQVYNLVKRLRSVFS